jgi:hypothetical protein
MSRMLTEGKSRAGKNIIVVRASLFLVVFLPLFFLVYCRPSPVILLPLPSKIERIEGYASLRVIGDQGSSRSKFSFLFQLPHQGRIEVSNIFGRTLYQIIVAEDKAAFIVPLYEMINLLSGKWENKVMEEEGEESKESWSFAKDERGRIQAGKRDEFRFEVQEFFADTPFARLLIFHHPLNDGRLKILRINLNRPLKKGAFSLSVLGRYERKSWAEIERILADRSQGEKRGQLP